MEFLLGIFAIVVVTIVIIALVSNNPQDIDAEAAHEAAAESPETLLRETTKLPETPQEREEENKRTEFENR